MAGLTSLLRLAILAATHAGAEELRIGFLQGPSSVDELGKQAMELWVAWANSGANTLGFTATFTVFPYSADTHDADVAALAALSDVLIPPYTSGKTTAFVAKVPSGFAGPILVWGGASDAIFSATCPNYGQHCFGSLSKGSQYMVSGLTALLALSAKPLTVSIIQNDNSFSSSVCNGAREFIDSTDGLTLVSEGVVQRGALSEEDKVVVERVMTSEPTVVVVCGHSGGDVEDVVMKIAEGPYVPHSILATNSITSSSRYDEFGKSALMNCLLMPTQWGMANTSDANVGWTSDTFTAAFGTGATYHAASAAASLIAVTDAMAHGNPADRVANLGTLMAAVDTDSFYGRLSFGADGSIAKPMYVQQDQGAKGKPVFTNMFGGMKTDLEMCRGWGTPLNCGMLRQQFKANGCCGNPGREITSFGIVPLA